MYIFVVKIRYSGVAKTDLNLRFLSWGDGWANNIMFNKTGGENHGFFFS